MAVAGHEFINGRCECGKLWVDIRGATESDVGTVGVAHRGGLTEAELGQIIDARMTEDARIAEAMGWELPKKYPAPDPAPDSAWRPGAPLKGFIQDPWSYDCSGLGCGYWPCICTPNQET